MFLEKEVQKEMISIYKTFEHYKEKLDKEDEFYFEKVEAAKRVRAMIAKEVIEISQYKWIDKLEQKGERK